MTQDYIIADLRLRISGNDWLRPFGHFARALDVFKAEVDPDEQPVLEVKLSDDIDVNINSFTEVDCFEFAEINSLCRLYQSSSELLFTITTEDGREARFIKPLDSPTLCCNFARIREYGESASMIRFGIWIMFGIAIAPHSAIAIHSSAIYVGDKAVLFLGESGTGKSTHTRLWRESIEGAKLLNDDSPIVRVVDSKARVYGSPWSGKTPCYKNSYKEIAGFVRLSQAPHNKMRQLNILHSIGALHPSCPPSLIKLPKVEDAIYNTLSAVLSTTKVFHLECLPNHQAAQLSYSTTIL